MNGKFSMSKMNWGSLTTVLVLLLALVISPVDVCSGDLATGVGVLDDVVYLAGIAKVIMDMVNKQKQAKQERDEQRRAQNDATYGRYNDVDSN